MRILYLLMAATLCSCATSEAYQASQNQAVQVSVRQSLGGADRVTVHFDFDEAELLSGGTSRLDDRIQCYLAYENLPIIIEGHADTRGSDQYNADLSLQRANAVKDFLVSRGVQSDRIDVQGLGEREIIDLGNTEEAHARNRRGNSILHCGSGLNAMCDSATLDNIGILAQQRHYKFNDTNLRFEQSQPDQSRQLAGRLASSVSQGLMISGPVPNFPGRSAETSLGTMVLTGGVNDLVREVRDQSQIVEIVRGADGRARQLTLSQQNTTIGGNIIIRTSSICNDLS